MSRCSIKPYFRWFTRVKITGQRVQLKENVAAIIIHPDERFTPICLMCKKGKVIDNWCQLVHESNIETVINFAKKLQYHREGILNYCHYAMQGSKLEGVNNTLKVIKQKAYGYRDTKYFILKAKQSFSGK